MSKSKTSIGKWQVPYDMSIWHKQIEGYSIDGCVALSESNLVFVFKKTLGEEPVAGPAIKLLRFYRDAKPQISGATLDNIKDISYITGKDAENSVWLTSLGDVYYLGKNKESSGLEEPIPNRDTDLGYKVIMGIDKVGDNIYAAGAWRHVFKRTGKSEWIDFAANIDRADIVDKKGKGWNIKKSAKTGFTALAGVAENDLYAGGDGADCWHYNGKSWSRVDLPTNEDIYKIVAVATDQIYMSCGGGILLQGGKENWKVIKRSGEKDNFTQMVYFKKSIYVATLFHMYQLVDGKLEECSPSKHNDDIDLMCHHYLSANDDIMLMCNEKSAAIFDGENWFPLVTVEG